MVILTILVRSRSASSGSPLFTNLISPEFRTFVDHTEHGLWELFQNIDRNNNGEIDKAELKTAFFKAGVTVSNAKLDDFFRDVDTNKDGVISYSEWR